MRGLRKWKAWALLTSEGEVHSITFLYDPTELQSTKGLIELGWSVIRVDVVEVPSPTPTPGGNE